MTKQVAELAKKWLNDAEAILITASNGLSISEGLNLFANNQKLRDVVDNELIEKYHLPNLLTAFAFQYPNKLDYWRVVARVVEYYSNKYTPSVYMKNLKQIVGDKPYFVWTSNVDHHFSLAGFNNLFEIEGNWLEGVCSEHPENHGTYNLASKIHELYEKDQAGELTETDIPVCEQCNSPLDLNMAGDNFQINQHQVNNFQKFIQKYENKKLLILELGIGPRNQLIKAPSMQLVAANPNSRYITINKGEVLIPDLIADRSIGYSATIGDAFTEILTGKSYGAKTQDPIKKNIENNPSPQELQKQEQAIQNFYPNYMVDQSFRPGSFPMYLTIDKDHPSYLHTVKYGQSFMYSIGDAAIVHCFTQNGQYYKVRLGLDKSKNEVHGFYADPGTFIAIETTDNNGVGFSQISTEIPSGSNGEIFIPKKEKLLQLFPNQSKIIERLSIKE